MVETRSSRGSGGGGDDAMRSGCMIESRDVEEKQQLQQQSPVPLKQQIKHMQHEVLLGADEEDERMFPDLVHKTNQEIDEDFIPAEFSDTDSEVEQENIDMGHFENHD
ncbi:hypothetical protein ZWY2020_037130 [Hordeum vulgare]|nr:hypothetical protein ZWY2020_037130 [Hordeum vulgare]